MDKIKTSIEITEEEKNIIENNSAKKLPLNPTAQGWSAAQIREKLYKAICGDKGSVLALFIKYFGLKNLNGDILVEGILSSIFEEIEEMSNFYVKDVSYNSNEFIIKVLDQDNNIKTFTLPFKDVYAKLEQLECDINYNRIGLLDVSEYNTDTGEITYAYNPSVINNMEYNDNDGLLTIYGNPIDWSCDERGVE